MRAKRQLAEGQTKPGCPQVWKTEAGGGTILGNSKGRSFRSDGRYAGGVF